MVRSVVGPDVEVVTTPTDDHRSYHISSEKIRRELGYVPKRTIEDAVRGLVRALPGVANPELHDRPALLQYQDDAGGQPALNATSAELRPIAAQVRVP